MPFIFDRRMADLGRRLGRPAPSPTRMATRRGRPRRPLRLGAAYRRQLVARRRHRHRLRTLLLLPRVARPQVATRRRRADADRLRTPRRRGPTRLRHRRHADETPRPKGPGGRTASQPDTGARRLEVPLRPQRGDAQPGRPSCPLRRDRAAPAGQALRPQEGRAGLAAEGRQSAFAPNWRSPPRCSPGSAACSRRPARGRGWPSMAATPSGNFSDRRWGAGFVVVARLRKDAALFDLPAVPPPGRKRGRGRPPIYGKNRLSLAKAGRADPGMAAGHGDHDDGPLGHQTLQELPGDVAARRRSGAGGDPQGSR